MEVKFEFMTGSALLATKKIDSQIAIELINLHDLSKAYRMDSCTHRPLAYLTLDIMSEIIRTQHPRFQVRPLL